MKKIVSIGFVLLGIISLILGICAMNYDGGYSSGSTDIEYAFHQVYGGDAYTGMQNAAADAANNAGVAAKNIYRVEGAVNDTTDAVAFGLGSILIVFGAFIVLYGLGTMPEKINSPIVTMEQPEHNENADQTI